MDWPTLCFLRFFLGVCAFLAAVSELFLLGAPASHWCFPGLFFLCDLSEEGDLLGVCGAQQLLGDLQFEVLLGLFFPDFFLVGVRGGSVVVMLVISSDVPLL